MRGITCQQCTRHDGLEKDPSLPPTYDNYGFDISPSTLVRELSKLGDIVKWPLKTNKPMGLIQIPNYGVTSMEIMATGHLTVSPIRREIQTLVKKGYLTEYTTET